MRYIPGYTGDIAGRERDGHCAAEFQGTAVGVADTHLQAIVEMEMFTSHIGYFPVIPGEKEYGKTGRKVIISVFNYRFWLFCWHRAPPFCKTASYCT
jgi:hypothetical protein